VTQNGYRNMNRVKNPYKSMVGARGLFGPGRASPLQGRPTGVDATDDLNRRATSCRLKTRAVVPSPTGVILSYPALLQNHRDEANDSRALFLVGANPYTLFLQSPFGSA